uniref:Uncharacterized protein n=1 Tax=Populus trichocarpa TaxID=3694 RepID=A0A2K1Y565_POPTR
MTAQRLYSFLHILYQSHLSGASTNSLAWLRASSSSLHRRKLGQRITLTFQEFCGNSINSSSLSEIISSSLKIIMISFHIKANLFASTWLDSSFL